MSYTLPSELPKPILFHPLKHHLQYIKAFIRQSTSATEAELKAVLLTIGSGSQLDLYIGHLTPLHIAQEVIIHLQQQGLLKPEVYAQYLTATGADYRMITLSDASDWVLRWGVVEERYAHLHPARYAVNTIRVKANLLKTAVAVLLAAERSGNTEISLQQVNLVRAEWLGLSPVKALNKEEGFWRLLELLRQE